MTSDDKMNIYKRRSSLSVFHCSFRSVYTQLLLIWRYSDPNLEDFTVVSVSFHIHICVLFTKFSIQEIIIVDLKNLYNCWFFLISNSKWPAVVLCGRSRFKVKRTAPINTTLTLTENKFVVPVTPVLGSSSSRRKSLLPVVLEVSSSRRKSPPAQLPPPLF